MNQPTEPIVLVTGATGFIGRHVTDPLVRRGAVVHAIIRKPASIQGATVWVADLFDYPRVAEVMATIRPTHLLHLAWDATPGRFWTSPDNLSWVAASLNAVRSFVENVGRRVVVAGTCAEYDWTAGNGIFNEADSRLRPATLYGVCKNALREVVETYCRQSGITWAWGRLFNPYGPDEPAGKLVGSTLRSLRAGEPARCTKGTQKRDYLYVDDVADALAALTLSQVDGPVNVGSGIGTPVADIVRTLGELAGRPDLVRIGELPLSPNDATDVVADISRLTELVGWRARYDLESGLKETVRNYFATSAS